MALQTTPCKHCGYQECDPTYGGILAQNYIVEVISKEPIKTFKCIRCGEEMQLHYQSHHRRFYKCWDCGMIDADPIFYESAQFKGLGGF